MIQEMDELRAFAAELVSSQDLLCLLRHMMLLCLHSL